MKDVVTMVKELDGQEITIVPSHGRQGRPGRHARGGVAAGASTGLKEVHELASASGVRIAIEPLNRFETYFINRGDQALALADAVAPDVGVCLDCVPHEHRGGRLPRGDPRRSATGSSTSTSPTTTGWRAAWASSTGRRSSATLQEVGYDGALTVEFVAPIDRTPGQQVSPTRSRPNPVDISPEELQFIIDHGSSLLSEGFYEHARREVRDHAAAAHLTRDRTRCR